MDYDWSSQVTDGWWKLCRVFDKNFPEKGNEFAVDPSALLSLIYFCTLFCWQNNLPRNLIAHVDFIRQCRNRLYGHIPELMIMPDLLVFVRKQSFNKIIEVIDELNRSIPPGVLNFNNIAIRN